MVLFVSPHSQRASTAWGIGFVLVVGCGAIGYAVGVRTKTGPADASWFWYERVNTTTYANGPGVPLCANCHRNAPRDFIYTQVTP